MAANLPRQDGVVAIVTGANTGIGKVTALELARAGAHVFLACRSADKTAPVIDEIRAATGSDNIEFLLLDLACLDSVRSAAAAFAARNQPLNLLINNAGLAGSRGATSDGFELAFGVNHLGHFLFTRLLLDRIERSAPARIVNVSSQSHRSARSIPWDELQRPTRSRTGLAEYSVSKLANVLFAAELARRLDGTGVTTYALHPGVIASDIWRGIPRPFRFVAKRFMRSVEEGAATTLYCATAPELAGESGQYYDDTKKVRPSRLAQDAELAAELWRRSEKWVGLASPTFDPRATAQVAGPDGVLLDSESPR